MLQQTHVRGHRTSRLIALTLDVQSSQPSPDHPRVRELKLCALELMERSTNPSTHLSIITLTLLVSESLLKLLMTREESQGSLFLTKPLRENQ
jgi:hypothetical protein